MTAITDEIRAALASGGLHHALQSINRRTTHRFTGVYRYEGDMLRNVALFDRWDPEAREGADAPMVETFCAILPSQGVQLEVVDGRSDPRFPWMRENPVVSYCGVLVRDGNGRPWGSVCHFDLQRCESASSHLPELAGVAPLIYEAVEAGARPAS